MSVGFIGLGNVGLAVAENLLNAQHNLVVHDLDPRRSETLRELGARWASTPREVAEQSDVVVTSLPSPSAVRSVVTGDDGMFAGMAPGTLWVETSTTDENQLEELATTAARSRVETLEATLTLGVHRMKSRTGTIFAGGDEAVYQANKSLLADMGGQVIYMGKLGSATIIKVITNTIAFVNLIGLSEGMMLAAKAGLDLNTAHKAIGASYGGSYVNETEMQVVLNGSFDGNFTIDLACKDLRLSEALCRQYGMTQEVTSMVAGIFEEMRNTLGDRAYSTEAARYVEEKAGQNLRAPGFPASLLELE